MALCYDSAAVLPRLRAPRLPGVRTLTSAKVYALSSEDPPVAEDDFLATLVADPARHWPNFLRRYTPTLLRLIERRYRAVDDQMDVYVFVCEKLAANQLEGLRRYLEQPPAERARFVVWLATVVRNRCVDWHRAERGRLTLPTSVRELGPVEQSIFRHVLWRRESYAATVELLAGEGHTGFTVGAIGEIVERIHTALPRTSRWTALLEALHGQETLSLDADSAEDQSPVGPLAGPEALEPDVRFEWQSILGRLCHAVETLDTLDQLVLFFRFEQGLRYRQIAALAGLVSERATYQRCQAALDRLRRELGVHPPTRSGGGGLEGGEE